MIDTCGLPMKFEFYVCGIPGNIYVVDFDQADYRGNPLMFLQRTPEEKTNGWKPKEISRNIGDGKWIICAILEEENLVSVEDLI